MDLTPGPSFKQFMQTQGEGWGKKNADTVQGNLSQPLKKSKPTGIVPKSCKNGKTRRQWEKMSSGSGTASAGGGSNTTYGQRRSKKGGDPYSDKNSDNIRLRGKAGPLKSTGTVRRKMEEG